MKWWSVGEYFSLITCSLYSCCISLNIVTRRQNSPSSFIWSQILRCQGAFIYVFWTRQYRKYRVHLFIWVCYIEYREAGFIRLFILHNYHLEHFCVIKIHDKIILLVCFEYANLTFMVVLLGLEFLFISSFPLLYSFT